MGISKMAWRIRVYAAQFFHWIFFVFFMYCIIYIYMFFDPMPSIQNPQFKTATFVFWLIFWLRRQHSINFEILRFFHKFPLKDYTNSVHFIMTNKNCAQNIFVGTYSKLRAWHELNLISKHSLINFTVILMNIFTINKLEEENKRILWLEFGGSVQSSDFAVMFSAMLVAVACFCSSIGSTLASHRSCDVDCLFFRFGQPHSSIIFIVIIANLDAGFLYIKIDVLLINAVK